MAKYDTAWMQSVGPPWDAVCGTAGESTNLNTLIAAGKKRIFLAEGAVLTAHLTISVADGFLYSPREAESLDLGAYQITVNAAGWHLEGFQINGSAARGIWLSTNANKCSLHRVSAINCTSHGIYLGNSHADLEIMNSYSKGNGASGVYIASGCVAARVIGCVITGNTGFGVNDLDDSSILVANRIESNVAGQINGTPAVNLNKTS